MDRNITFSSRFRYVYCILVFGFLPLPDMDIASLLLHIMLHKLLIFFAITHTKTNSKNVFYYDIFAIGFSLQTSSKNFSNKETFNEIYT
jgi:hypothetical protein